MDGWERAYRNLRLEKLGQSPIRFLLYGATLSFWAQVSTWLLLRRCFRSVGECLKLPE